MGRAAHAGRVAPPAPQQRLGAATAHPRAGTRLRVLRCRRTVTDPYLSLFRGIIPPLGGTLDLSPILAFVVLNVSKEGEGGISRWGRTRVVSIPSSPQEPWQLLCLLGRTAADGEGCPAGRALGAGTLPSDAGRHGSDGGVGFPQAGHPRTRCHLWVTHGVCAHRVAAPWCAVLHEQRGGAPVRHEQRGAAPAARRAPGGRAPGQPLCALPAALQGAAGVGQARAGQAGGEAAGVPPRGRGTLTRAAPSLARGGTSGFATPDPGTTWLHSA